MPNNYSLFETVVVSANDTFVDLFLKDKIKFQDIAKNIIKLISLKEFVKYKKIKPKKIQDIINLDKLVRLKIASKGI